MFDDDRVLSGQREVFIALSASSLRQLFWFSRLVAGVCRSPHDNVWNRLSATVPTKIMLIRYKGYVEYLWIYNNCTWNGVVPCSYTNAFTLHFSWKLITPCPPYQGYEIAPRCIILCSQPVSNDRTHSSHFWGWVVELLLMAVTITRLSKCIFNVQLPPFPPIPRLWNSSSMHHIVLTIRFQW